MILSPKLYFKDRWIIIPLVLAIISEIFIWWYTAANIHPSPEQTVLHYNIVVGVDLLGDWWKIFYLTGSGLLVLLVNYVLGFFFYNYDKILSRTLSVLTALFHIMFVISLILIVRLNI